MKRLTVLAVITILVVFGCSAAFGEGIVTLGFVDSTGTELYCDYLNFSYGSTLASGIDVASLCGVPDGTLIGVVTSFPQSLEPVTGQIVMLADSENDAFYEAYTGVQPILVTKTTPSKTHFGWEVFFNDYDDFEYYLNSWGYLTKELPLAPVAREGKTGKASVPASVVGPSKRLPR